MTLFRGHLQLDIGWFAIMCGYVTTALMKCQHHAYYRYIDSRKHGKSWGRQLSSKLWNLTRSIWIHRNSVMHETSTIHELSGLTATLCLSITAEYNMGRGDLPMPYSPFFYYSTLPFLLSKYRHLQLRRSLKDTNFLDTTVQPGKKEYII